MWNQILGVLTDLERLPSLTAIGGIENLVMCSTRRLAACQRATQPLPNGPSPSTLFFRDVGWKDKALSYRVFNKLLEVRGNGIRSGARFAHPGDWPQTGLAIGQQAGGGERAGLAKKLRKASGSL